MVVALELRTDRHLVAVEGRLSGDLITDLLRPGGPARPHAVHPNTVAYRLGRIEQLTGRSLRGVDNRLEFQLAMTIRNSIRVDPTAAGGGEAQL